MTDKEYKTVVLIGIFMVGLLIGVVAGVIIVALRYDIEIRIDQLELKKDVAEIKIDKAIVEDIIKVFLFETEQVKLESQRLRDLQLKLSKGE